MKIERISENQIRCTLTSFDLSVRNLNLGELAYGSEKARNLFREMIQKASNEVGFEAEDIPLMVEAIPLSNESVMLVITKIEDPEELDTRFSKFSPANEEDGEGLLSELANELLEGADGLLGKIADEAQKAEPQQKAGQAPESAPAKGGASTRIYSFESLDQVTDAAHAVGSLAADTANTLYKKPDTRQYYLVLRESEDSKVFSRICNILAEYGTKVRSVAASEAYYREHYEAIAKERALEILSRI